MNQSDLDELVERFSKINEEFMDIDSSDGSRANYQSKQIATVMEHLQGVLNEFSLEKRRPILEKFIPLCIQHLPNLSREGKATVVKFIERQINDPTFD